VAAYRFLANPAIGVQERLSGHTHATLARLRAHEVVLLVQDTTFWHDGTPHPKVGVGTVQHQPGEASLLPPPVACTPERVNVGVVGMPVWQRPEPPVAPQRKRTPIAEKERYRGLEGEPWACKLQQACPATLVVHRAEREGDSQEWLVDALEREPGQRAEVIMRAKCHRRIGPGAAQRDVWAERPQTRSMGTLPSAVARQPERPPRSAPVAVTAQPVPGYGARRPGGTLPPVTGRAVEAQEPSPPPGEAPMAW
jgi:hypothetical protein